MKAQADGQGSAGARLAADGASGFRSPHEEPTGDRSAEDDSAQDDSAGSVPAKPANEPDLDSDGSPGQAHPEAFDRNDASQPSPDDDASGRSEQENSEEQVARKTAGAESQAENHPASDTDHSATEESSSEQPTDDESASGDASADALSASEPGTDSDTSAGPARVEAEEDASNSSPDDDASERSERGDSKEQVPRKTAGAESQTDADPASVIDHSAAEESSSEQSTDDESARGDGSADARSASEPDPDSDTDAGPARIEAEEDASNSSPDDDASGQSEREDSKERVSRKAAKAEDQAKTDPASIPPDSPPDPESPRDGALAQPRSERQGEMPFALVEGEPMTVLPKDLYIPPQALEIFLEAFEGPLDLLLYLIKRKNLDILDVPIAEITLQYIEYIELMKELQLELAAEYLVMAATLAEIKSRMLLPRSESVDEEEDPRAELVRRLQEYERYKEAAARLERIPRVGRDFAELKVDAPMPDVAPEPPVFRLDDLIAALSEVLSRAKMYRHYQVRPEPLSVRERMSIVLDRVQKGSFIEFTTLFTPEEGRQGVVVTFLALLELLRESLVELSQAQPFGPIHVKATGETGE